MYKKLVKIGIKVRYLPAKIQSMVQTFHTRHSLHSQIKNFMLKLFSF